MEAHITHSLTAIVLPVGEGPVEGKAFQMLICPAKSLFAILVSFLNHWQHYSKKGALFYLQRNEFFGILTDHKNLSHLNEQRLHTPWQRKVFTKLLGLQYKTEYITDLVLRTELQMHCLAVQLLKFLANFNWQPRRTTTRWTGKWSSLPRELAT